MITSDLIKQAAIALGYWDFDTAAVQTGKDVTETIILDAINHIYRDRVFPELSQAFPEMFVANATCANYDSTSTISSNVTTTLVTNDSIFTSGCVGSIVYNSTQDATAYISAYTSGTTVTLDAEYGWDASDTIYLFTGIYSFGGESTDIFNFPRYVGIKYATTDKDYTECTLVNTSLTDGYGRGREYNESMSTVKPVYNITTITASSVSTSAIIVKPIPTSPDTTGVYIEYIQQPAELTAGADTPRLPAGFHTLLANGAVAYIADAILNDTPKAAKFEKRFVEGFMSLMNTSQSFDEISEDGQLESRIYSFRNRSY